jgi:nitrite reductase/ring-hydroxylating ferredoxin subunit
MTRVRSIRLPAASVLNGDRITLCEIDGRRVGLIRVAGKLHAFADRCPHRGAPICSHGEVVAEVVWDGPGSARISSEARLLRCPWHKWDFDLATGVCAVASKYRLRLYHVWEDDGDVVVSLDPPPG